MRHSKVVWVVCVAALGWLSACGESVLDVAPPPAPSLDATSDTQPEPDAPTPQDVLPDAPEPPEEVGQDVLEDVSRGEDIVEVPDAVEDVAPDVPAVTPDPGPEGAELLLDVPGVFLEVVGQGEGPERAFEVGEVGVQYAQIVVVFDAFHGGWREDLFDRAVLNHNLFGLFRHAPRHHERYLLGTGAQIHPPRQALQKTALFFARVDLEPREQGMGYTGYQTFKRGFGWTPGVTYRLRSTLDAAAARQVMEIIVDGELQTQIVGEIPYLNPSLTASGFYVEFGGEETTHRDVKPVGWRFSDLRVFGVLR